MFIRLCHEDVIFTRKSHNYAGTAFVQGDSAGGSKLTEQTLAICLTIFNNSIKVSSQSRNFEFNVFSIIHLMAITFDVLDRSQENKVLQTAQIIIFRSQVKDGSFVTMETVTL